MRHLEAASSKICWQYWKKFSDTLSMFLMNQTVKTEYRLIQACLQKQPTT